MINILLKFTRRINGIRRRWVLKDFLNDNFNNEYLCNIIFLLKMSVKKIMGSNSFDLF